MLLNNDSIRDVCCNHETYSLFSIFALCDHDLFERDVYSNDVRNIYDTASVI